VSWDPYLDLQSGVLRNRLGITDAAELARAEAELTSYRLIELRADPLPGGYDLPHLQAFHRHIFPTAGEVFARLARDHHLRGRDHAGFVDGLTALLAEVNALHPFREGNGRTQRAFLAQLARDAGYRIRWADMDPGTNFAASAAARDGDTTPLRGMLERLVAPLAAPPPRTPPG
jgi:cell filamentation protein